MQGQQITDNILCIFILYGRFDEVPGGSQMISGLCFDFCLQAIIAFPKFVLSSTGHRTFYLAHGESSLLNDGNFK